MFAMCAMDYWSRHESNNTTSGKNLGLSLVSSVVAGNVEISEFADFVVAVEKVGFAATVDFVEIGPYFDYGLDSNRVPNSDRVRDVHNRGKKCY